MVFNFTKLYSLKKIQNMTILAYKKKKIKKKLVISNVNFKYKYFINIIFTTNDNKFQFEIFEALKLNNKLFDFSLI